MPTNNLKHVGNLVNTQRRCIVVFREVPDDIDNCLVVDTDALPDWMHDDVIKAVESPAAQAAGEFYEYAQRTVFTDGSPMLTKLHTAKLLQKQPSTNVSMTPNRETSILLSDLNALIRQQANGGKPLAPEAKADAPVVEDKTLGLSDNDIAQQLLTQAEQFEKEALALRESAYEMSPELKPRRGRPSKAKVEAKAQAEAEAEAES